MVVIVTTVDPVHIYTTVNNSGLLYLSQNIEQINTPEVKKALKNLSTELGYVIWLNPKDNARQEHIQKFNKYAWEYGENVKLDWYLE